MSQDRDAEEQLRGELEHITSTMEQLNVRLSELTVAVDAIRAENERDSALPPPPPPSSSPALSSPAAARRGEAGAGVVAVVPPPSATSSRQQFASLAAEDAADRVLHLQNEMAIVRRRNEMLAREKADEQRTLQLRGRQLDEVTRRVDELISLTGWAPNRKPVGEDVRNTQRAAIAEMTKLEAAVQHELRGAKGVLQRKEQTILALNATLAQRRERAHVLRTLQNDARDKARACAELQSALERMRSDGGSLDRALVRVEESKAPKANSVAALERDNAFLAQVAGELKQTNRRQDTIARAQLARQEQLQSRLDAVMMSLREMGLARDFEQSNDVRALVPAGADGACTEPLEVAQVLPADERVPIHTYRLLCKNSEPMMTQVARKNMLVLEKESVLQALEAKLSNYIAAFNATALQDDGIRAGKNVEMSDLLDELQARHESYRSRVKQLRSENHELREKLARRAPPPPPPQQQQQSSSSSLQQRRRQQQQQHDAMTSPMSSACDTPHKPIAQHA